MMTTTNPNQDVAIVPSVASTLESYRRGLEPKGYDEAVKLAATVGPTRMFGVSGPEDALIRLMTGRELGLTSMQSLRGIYVVEGRPGLDASLMMALSKQSPDCERFECIEESDTSVTYAVKRKGEKEQKVTWSMKDAERAGLLNRGDDEKSRKMNNWNKYPRQMMHARCKAEGARRVFPDRLFGLLSIDEIREGDALLAEGTPVEPPAALPTTAPYETLASELFAEIAAASTKDALKAVRDRIKKAKEGAQLPEPWLSQVSEAYGVKATLAKPAPAPSPEPTPAPAAATEG